MSLDIENSLSEPRNSLSEPRAKLRPRLRKWFSRHPSQKKILQNSFT